jgi:hypothetical protein
MGRIQKLRSQLEWIGGIDPETIKEYQETQERHTFLAKQTDDLRETLASLDLVVRELDATIRERPQVAGRAFTFLSTDRAFLFLKTTGLSTKLRPILSSLPEVRYRQTDQRLKSITVNQTSCAFHGMS